MTNKLISYILEQSSYEQRSSKGGIMKKLNITREELILTGMDIAKKEGLSNITIRSFATKADVSIGTVYHYFENKDNLLSEIIEGYWNETIDKEIELIVDNSTDFIKSIEDIYTLLLNKSLEFHEFLIKDLMSIKGHSSNQMDYHLEEVKNKFKKLTINHEKVLKKVEEISNLDDFLNYLVDNIFTSLKRKNKDLGFMQKSLEIILN